MSFIYRINYKKNGPLRFISHLDFNALFRRTLRRTRMPVELTQGYNPRFKVSFGPALPLGIAGRHEILELYLASEVVPEEIQARINRASPMGLNVIEVEKVCKQDFSLNKLLRWASYLIMIEFKDTWRKWVFKKREEWLTNGVQTFLNQKHIIVEKQTKKGLKNIDLRPCIQTLEYLTRPDKKELFLRLVIDIKYKGSINPGMIITQFLNHLEDGNIHMLEIVREKLILDRVGKDQS